MRTARDPFSLEPLTAQLLVFDPPAFGYEGRAAIAVGDVDTADHVAFLVPGLGSEVRSSMAALTGNALRVTRGPRGLRRARRRRRWRGWATTRRASANVVFDGAAEDGADLLAADVLAVQASRDVVPHLTVIGHSYGSTTAGTALRDHETGTDDVVLVGSPGPNVERRGDLHVPAGHVFVGASSRDPVSYVDRFGEDPTHEEFGAIRFQAEDTDPQARGGSTSTTTRSTSTTGTESLANIVDVVVGRLRGVERAAYRDEVFLLPDGINSDPEADREPTDRPGDLLGAVAAGAVALTGCPRSTRRAGPRVRGPTAADCQGRRGRCDGCSPRRAPAAASRHGPTGPSQQPWPRRPREGWSGCDDLGGKALYQVSGPAGSAGRQPRAARRSSRRPVVRGRSVRCSPTDRPTRRC